MIRLFITFVVKYWSRIYGVAVDVNYKSFDASLTYSAPTRLTQAARAAKFMSSDAVPFSEDL